MESPSSIVDMAREFLQRGYKHDFRVDGAGLRDVTADRRVDLHDIQVDASYRFELTPDAGDASNLYAITDLKHGSKGLLIDAFDLLELLGAAPLQHRLTQSQELRPDDDSEVATRFGLRKVSKSEFGEDPDRYVLRIGFPDFPECPFGESFSMLGFDTAEQTYVWLATKILRDDRLARVPFQPGDIPDNR